MRYWCINKKAIGGPDRKPNASLYACSRTPNLPPLPKPATRSVNVHLDATALYITCQLTKLAIASPMIFFLRFYSALPWTRTSSSTTSTLSSLGVTRSAADAFFASILAS
jgi:hypothetical protein